MIIKLSILNECLRFTTQPKREYVLQEQRKAILKTAAVLQLKHVRIDNRDPLWLMCMAMLRNYKPEMTKEEFNHLTYYTRDKIAFEAHMTCESNPGRLAFGNYFNEDVKTICCIDDSLDNEYPDKHPITIYYHQDIATSGITPLTRRDSTNEIATIIYTIIKIGDILFDEYCKHSHMDDEGKVVFEKSLSDFIYRNLYLPCIDNSHDRAMLSRYSLLLNSGQLPDEGIDQKVAVPDYTQKLNLLQREYIENSYKYDALKNMTRLPLTSEKVILDLLKEDMSLAIPMNHQWVECLNELSWAEFYLDLGGSNTAVLSSIKRYLREIKSQGVITNCPHALVVSAIKDKIDIVEYSLT